ncbi:hypothetical protein O8B41_12685 [Agrobacterium rhizogenes]|nr:MULTISPECIES: hypothetical protein [Rhizobium/Agrobacterium group]MCZ7470048.1 hypothetical protein [Rhizobium rhizogenes]
MTRKFYHKEYGGAFFENHFFSAGNMANKLRLLRILENLWGCGS